MKAYILSGMSGSGKSLALKYLEDAGLTCIDNIPQSVIPNILEAFSHGQKNIVITVDIRSADDFDAARLVSMIQELKDAGHHIETIFLEAAEDVLLHRYQETRRVHPLCGKHISTKKALLLEKERLAPLRESARYLIDTSALKPKGLQKKIMEIAEAEEQGLKLHILSFGFKRGLPEECDLVFDVRVLPNPFYIPELGRHTGLEDCIKDFVLSNENARIFLEKLEDMLCFLIPSYINEGKLRLVIGIGCTGGAHRSVVMSEELARRLAQYKPIVTHRDLEKEQALWEIN